MGFKPICAQTHIDRAHRGVNSSLKPVADESRVSVTSCKKVSVSLTILGETHDDIDNTYT